MLNHFSRRLKFLIGICFLSGHTVFANDDIVSRIQSQRIFFDVADREISLSMEPVLYETLHLLSQLNGPYTLKVVGYTDDRGPEPLNQELSVQRASAVAQYLVSQGIDRNRVVIQGLGRESPVAGNETPEGRSLNRRVEFQFISSPSGMPPLVASVEGVPLDPEPKEEEPIEDHVEPPVAEEEPAPVLEKTAEPEKEPVETTTEEMTEPPAVLENTMIASTGKRSKPKYKRHVYEDRKRNEEGQAFVQVAPVWLTMNGVNQLGTAGDRISSDIGIEATLGWRSFLEENYETYFSVQGRGAALQFSADAGAGIADKQKEYYFNGELALGRYFHPNVAFQIQSGYGRQLFYRSSGPSIIIDSGYLWHGGLSVEGIFWRFSEKGDLGGKASFNYYAIGADELDSGTGYSFEVFADYDFLRGGFFFSFSTFETDDLEFDSWSFGPALALYF